MTTLGAHIQTQKGYAFKSDWYCQEGRAIVKVSNFTEESIDLSELVCISEDVAQNYLKYELKPDDVVIQTVGSWPSNPNSVVGKAIRVPCNVSGALLNQNAVKVEPTEGLDKGFLYYLLKGEHFKSYIVGTAQGAASQASITLDSIRAFEFELPQLARQKWMAEILSTYDDLVDNNTRRIKILEEMAQALYREWFVQFRFPGHEQVKLVDERIPQGWDLKKLTDLCDVVMGQSPKSEFYNEAGEGLPFHQGVTNFGDRFPVDCVYCTVENRIAEKGDILCSVRAPVGRLNIADKKIVIGRGLCAIRSKTANQTFVFQQLREKFHEEDTMGGGTIFKSVTKDDMHGIEMLWPDEASLARFDECVIPIFQELENLTSKNANLRRTRDLLLPKLVSGEMPRIGISR